MFPKCKQLTHIVSVICFGEFWGRARLQSLVMMLCLLLREQAVQIACCESLELVGNIQTLRHGSTLQSLVLRKIMVIK